MEPGVRDVVIRDDILEIDEVAESRLVRTERRTWSLCDVVFIW